MNKNEFLTTLEKSLVNISTDEKKDIMYDYEEHFRMGEKNGKSEEDLVNELGDPWNIAKQYRVTQSIDLAQSQPNTKNVFNAVFAAISLGLFNLIFILGPFIGIVGILIGLFAASVGITVAGGGMLLGTILSPVIPQYVNLPIGIPSAVFAFYGVGTMALGALFFIGLCYLCKYFYIGTIKYLRWNMNVITK
jgi:uncharacterized membrane protein